MVIFKNKLDAKSLSLPYILGIETSDFTDFFKKKQFKQKKKLNRIQLTLNLLLLV